MKAVLVGADNQDAVNAIGQALGGKYKVEHAGSRPTCLEKLHRKRYECGFIDLSFLREDQNSQGRQEYAKALRAFREYLPGAVMVVLAPQKQIRDAVSAVKAGADNYLTYPIDPQEVEFVIASHVELQQMEWELNHFRDHFWRDDLRQFVRTNSPVMKEVLDKVQSVAPTRTTVLLAGETGTGKSLMAKLIHSHSNRPNGPYISVHCGSIPDTLVESELFGHEKGAFTGAVRRKLGKFQVADGGTIFLDEIGTMSKAVQVKLLEVLQEGKFTRVGGESPIEVDVRVVAASNVDLKKLTDEGYFRQDLFFRLNVFPIELTPLRVRREDIPILVEHFLDRLNRIHGKYISAVDGELIAALENYSWPGNIRELENLMERAYILEKTNILSPTSFPSDLFTFESLGAGQATQKVPTLADIRRKAVEEAERRYLREILTMNRGRIEKTAAIAGITSRQLHNQMQKYALRKEDFK